eukprot:1153724-Pelagomonas_calceolata.AAC.8
MRPAMLHAKHILPGLQKEEEHKTSAQDLAHTCIHTKAAQLAPGVASVPPARFPSTLRAGSRSTNVPSMPPVAMSMPFGGAQMADCRRARIRDIMQAVSAGAFSHLRVCDGGEPRACQKKRVEAAAHQPDGAGAHKRASSCGGAGPGGLSSRGCPGATGPAQGSSTDMNYMIVHHTSTVYVQTINKVYIHVSSSGTSPEKTIYE